MMNKIAKGYSAVSVLARAPYNKESNSEKNTSRCSVLELYVYNRADCITKELWKKIKTKIGIY